MSRVCTIGGSITIGQAVKPGSPFGSLAAVANPKDAAVATASVTTVKPTTTTVTLFAPAATTGTAVASGKCEKVLKDGFMVVTWFYLGYYNLMVLCSLHDFIYCS